MFRKKIVQGLLRFQRKQPIFQRLNSNAQVDKPLYPGSRSEFTPNLHFMLSTEIPGIPVYRVLDLKGQFINTDSDPNLGKETVTKMFKTMILLHAYDQIMFESHNQGRITFYMTNYGEEGAQIGSAAALDSGDLVFAQYREVGVGLWRGMTVNELVNECYGNKEDLNDGKQMPIHYSSKEHNFFSLSSPLATQMPQASGAAYGFKRAQNGKCAVCYFGDGTASEGDAHPAFNFAATLECPVIFFCRNNGYAISTPVSEQYRGDGIAIRGIAYGIETIRVDGNDVFAVYNATKAAREICVNESRPVLIEAMSYRVGPHSTGDDHLSYRTIEEINYWDKIDNPILRLKYYMLSKGWWSEAEEKTWRNDARKLVIQSIERAEKLKSPNPMIMFTDVCDTIPKRLRGQMNKHYDFLQKNKANYPKTFDPMEKF